MLNRNGKQFGPMNALDLDSSSSCWNSEGTSGGGGTVLQPQWMQVEFAGRTVRPNAVCVQFQAGFSAESCRVEFLEAQTRDSAENSNNINNNNSNNHQWKLVGQAHVEWEDDHVLQRNVLSSAPNCSAIRLIWNDNFADLYGRVIIYQVQVWGQQISDD